MIEKKRGCIVTIVIADTLRLLDLERSIRDALQNASSEWEIRRASARLTEKAKRK